MSTTLDRRKAQKNYAEFDEYISYQLQKTQTGIRSTDIFTALCGAAVFVVSYLLVFVIFDHWVVTGGFGPGMRIILLSGLLIGTLVWLGWKVVWPFFRRVNSLYAARALEQASPDLKSTLINYVDLRSANRDVSPAIIESMERRAAVTLSHAEVDDAIDRSTLLRLSYALLTAVVLFSVYAVASPKKVWPSIVRIFAPGSEVSVSTQTTFLKVDPGDTTILAREFLTITADLSGEVPQEVTLLYTTADGQFVDEPSPMREVEAGLKRYRCILKGNSGEGLLQGLSYRIVAGDASTRTYNVKVSQPPSATVTSLHYSFPDYMELPPEQPIGSGIDTWEGTHIQITATANMPVSSARLQFSDEAEFPARCEEMLMTVADDGVTLTPSKPWQPIIRDDGTYPGFYRIQCRTRDGATDPAPVVHSIRLQADQKPDASTLQPNRDMEVAANAIVPLLIQASDPDFRLSRVILRMKNGSRSLADRPLYKGDDRTKQIQYDLKIADLNVQERDVITWWVEAHDNRLVETPIRTLLDANRSATPQLQFTVRAPIPDEEVNKQLEQDRKRAQEKLDELNQQPGKSDLSPDESEPDAPGQQPEVKSDAPSDSNDPTQEKDDSQPAKSVDNERNSDGDGGGSGNKPESDSEPKSNNQTTKDGEGQTGKSDGDHAETGKKEPGKDDAGTEAKPDSPNTKSGPRKPVSNDGSQDDEILKELLKQNRDSKPNSDQGGNGNDDKANDRQKAGDGGKDQPQHDDRADDDDKSPKKPDNADDSPSQNADQPDPNSTEKNPNAKPDPSSKAETSPKKGADGQTPDEPVNDPSGQPTEKQADQNPADGTLAERSNDPPKDGQDSGSPDTPKKDGSDEKSTESAKPEPSNSAEKQSDSQNNDSGDSPQNDGDSGKQPSEGKQPLDDSSTKPDTGKPKSDGGADGDGNADSSTGSASSDKPPGKDSDGGKDGGAKKSEGGSSSKSDSASRSDQPGTPGDGSSGGKGGTSSESSPADGASSPSDNNTGKSGAGSDSTSKPPGSGESETDAESGRKSNSDSPSSRPDQVDSDQPGNVQENASKSNDDAQAGKETGSKPGKENSASDKGGDQKSGDAKDGKSGGKSSPGDAAGKSGSGKSSGGKPEAGKSGSGQSGQPGGNPGQSTGGSPPKDGSDPGGDAAVRPDENANPDEAVQRPGSGANIHDPNLPDADQANLEDKLKASNMVLKRLKEELDRGEVDPELLKKLGWTESDMQRFAERLERQLAQPKPNDPGAEARRRQFEEVLRSVDLESSGRQQEGNFNEQKSTNNFSERHLPAPPAHRKAYEDYIKKLSGQRRGTPATPASK